MKKMTCNQLGGACELEFRAETFDEIKKMSMEHGMEMFQKGDEAHLAAMQKMKGLMQEPGAMETWMDKKRQEFEAMPDDV